MRVRSSGSKRLLSLSLIFAALIPAFYCTQMATAGPPSHASLRAGGERGSLYFPLRQGYKWTYAVTSETTGSAATWQVEVLHPSPALTPMNGYYRLHNYFQDDETRLVRGTPFGTVMEHSQNGDRRHLWYELEAEVGQSWTMQLAPPVPACEDGAVLTMSARDDVVSVPAGEFTRVLRIDRLTSLCQDAGIASEWFAPGVGLIRRVEETIAGPVVSELIHAELGNEVWPSSSYTTTLGLSGARFVNNLMPPVDPDGLPEIRGFLTVGIRHPTDAPTEFVFSGCKSLTLEIVNADDVLVRTLQVDDGGCCACDALLTVDLNKEAIRLPFRFVLADDDGEALPDGFYGITAILNSQDPKALRPAARARIEVVSVH